MKLRFLAILALIMNIPVAISAMQKPAGQPLKLGGSTQQWYKDAVARNLSNPILLRYVYAKRDNMASSGHKLISIHPGTQRDYIWAVVGPQTFNLYDEAYMSMDPFVLADNQERPLIIFRAPNNNVYLLNFQRMSNYSETTPLYNAVLERITNTSGTQALRSAQPQQVLGALQNYLNLGLQLPKEQIDSLGYVTPGEVLTVLADDQNVYLSKGNK